MRLGLLADIHEAVEQMREALVRFAALGVDEVVVVGDVCCMHKHLTETVELLAGVASVGVWGNHDFGLCQQDARDLDTRFPPQVLAYMRTLRPILVRDDVLISHVEPWLDPNDLMQLWYFEGFPDTVEKLVRCFNAVPQRVLISGHVHRWLLGTPDGLLDWQGDGPIRLSPPGRFLLQMDAVCNGACALYDTTTAELTPIHLTRAS